MNSPKVSICIPCHNAAPYVGAALDSALAQTWPNLEIIVVDDDSTDESAAVLESYADRGVKIITEKCGSAAKARNRAWAEATGDYIKFFDADDILSSGCVAQQLEVLAGYPNSIAASEWGRFYQDDLGTFKSNPKSVWRDLPSSDWLIEDWMDGKPMTQPGMFLIPRKLIDLSGPWSDGPLLHEAPNDDFEFFARLFCHADTIRFTPEAILYYRSGLFDSLSKRSSRAAVEALCHCLLKGTQYLIDLRSDAAARLASANLLQQFIYSQYPNHSDLIKRMQLRICTLGGSNLPPDGPPRFQKLRKLVGWKIARRIQRLAGH